MTFNITKQAEAAEKFEGGLAVSLVDALTGKPSGATMLVAGLDSRRSREARRKAYQAVLDARPAERSGDERLNEEEIRDIGTRILAGCVISWEGIENDEGPLECTFENILQLFRSCPHIEDDVDARIANRRNFIIS